MTNLNKIITDLSNPASISIPQSIERSIHVLIKLMELCDPYTALHQKNVSKISVAIAEQLNLHAENIELLRASALVHDFGKIMIPSELLTKSKRLLESEYDVIKEHADYGYLAISKIPNLEFVSEIVWQHHERTDGSGYPRGLKGNQILIEARILAIADIIDSMASDRPYRPALGLERAMIEIKNRAGVSLDTSIVDAAVELDNQGKLQALLKN